jgi:hypothetical protein
MQTVVNEYIINKGCVVIKLFHLYSVPGGKINNLKGHSIGHYKQKNCIYT